MADQQIEIQLKTIAELGGLKDAVQSLNKVTVASKEAQVAATSVFTNLKKSISNIPLQLGAVAAGYASVSAAIGFVGDSLKEAIAAEQVVNELRASFEDTGKATDNAVQSIQEYATALQSVTIFGDDLIVQQIAIARNFGLSTNEAKKLVQAATELSAVRGIDLNTSVEALLKSLTGQLPRELNLLGSEFKNLTEEQLKAGAAQDLIAQKFSGRALEATKTLGGSIAQLREQYSNLQESFGDFLVKTLNLPGALRGVSYAIKRLTGEQTELQKLSKEFNSLRSEIPRLKEALANPLKFPERGSPKEIREELERLQQRLPIVTKQLNELKEANRAPAGSDDKKESIFRVDQNSINNYLATIKAVGKTATQIAKDERDERLRLLAKEFGGIDNIEKNTVDNKRLYADAKFRIEKEYLDKVSQENKKIENEKYEAQKRLDEIAKKADEEALKRTERIKKASEDVVGSLIKFGKGKATEEEKIGGIGGAIGSTTKGAEGARNLLVSGVSAAANAILPGSGEIIGPLIGELSKGKEAAKAFVTEFLNSIPDMIIGLIEALPAFVSALATGIPVIIQRLIESLPQLIQGLIEGIHTAVGQLVALMPTVAIQFAESLIETAPAIGEAIIKSIGNAPKNLGGSLGRVFGFAGGGSGEVVRSVPGGSGHNSTEKFPALLGSGELVIRRNTSNQLEKFLNEQESGTSKQSNESNDSMVKAIMALANRPIEVSIDGRVVAKAVRSQVRSGLVIA